MKHAFLTAALIIASSAAFANTTSVLLDIEKVFSMSAEEYAAAVRNAPDVNARNKDGETALHFAAASRTPANITVLLSAGAEVDAREKSGWTALHFAAATGAPEKIAALLEAGASGSIRDKDGKTAFDVAEANKRIEGTDAYWALNDAQYK